MNYKITEDLCSDRLKGLFLTESHLSNYPLMNSLDINVPRKNLEFSKQSFYYYAAKVWKDVPLNIGRSSTICTFKRS